MSSKHVQNVEHASKPAPSIPKHSPSLNSTQQHNKEANKNQLKTLHGNASAANAAYPSAQNSSTDLT